MFRRISFSGFTSGFNNFSFGMLFSVIFHGTIFFATIFAVEIATPRLSITTPSSFIFCEKIKPDDNKI